jgi:hypothetical protein
VWARWKQALVVVSPDTVVRWQRRRFREYWTHLSAPATAGRPTVGTDIKTLIARMAAANPLWGAPRLHGELLKLGIDIAERMVSRLMPKRRPGPSQTWRTFLANHIRDLVAIDFFTVPRARLRVLFILVVLAHDRRRVVHFNVTEHPTAQWTAPQIVDAFPDDSAPAHLLRDRDAVYGDAFPQRLTGMGIEEVLTAPHSPWQNPFAERLIGSIPARVSQSRARAQRVTPPPHPDPIPRLLPSGADTSLAREGRPRLQDHRASRRGPDRTASGSRRPTPSLRSPSRVVEHPTVFCTGGRAGLAYLLSLIIANPVDPPHGRQSEKFGSPVSRLARGRGTRGPLVAPKKSNQVLAKDTSPGAARLPIKAGEVNLE